MTCIVEMSMNQSWIYSYSVYKLHLASYEPHSIVTWWQQQDHSANSVTKLNNTWSSLQQYSKLNEPPRGTEQYGDSNSRDTPSITTTRNPWSPGRGKVEDVQKSVDKLFTSHWFRIEQEIRRCPSRNIVDSDRRRSPGGVRDLHRLGCWWRLDRER